MGYFDRKNELKEKARLHNEYVESNLREDVNNSVKNTEVYSNGCSRKEKTTNLPQVFVSNQDSVSAAYNEKSGKTCVLNFASYKEPGGMFMQGSSAQEECLCHASALYNVLKRLPDYYEWNKKNLRKAMYTNRALYSKDVVFYKDDKPSEKTKFDVLTCAAPNFSPGKKYGSVTQEENTRALDSRIKFVCDILSENKVDTVILGAWGCGVFGQDPKEVAELFKKHIENGELDVQKVVFAILPGKNLEAFRDVFGDERNQKFSDIERER